MSDLYWLTGEQMARLSPYFPESHGRQGVDGKRVQSGIIFVNRNGLRRYKRRNPIEIMFGRLKDCHRVTTRYDRCPSVYFSELALAATVLFWL